jgi:hypothetical protein
MRKSINIILLVLSTTTLWAQPDCRSILGLHLKSIAETPFSWAIEGMGAVGVMPDRTVANWTAMGALDFTFKKNNIYFEGAYKNWYNTAKNPDGNEPQTGLPDYNRPTQYHWGFRELHYLRKSESFQLKAGIQGVKTDDYFLFDERMLGLSASKSWNGLKLSANTGTVSQRLARFQDVCGTRHIYNVFHRSQFNFVGDKPGKTNFAAAFLKWTPKKASPKPISKEDEFDEFSDNSFSVLEIKEKGHHANKWKWSESGIFFYEEFGSGFHEFKYYSGAFSAIQIPWSIQLKGQLVDQYILNDHALAFYISAQKNLAWRNGNHTQIDATYLGKINLTPNAHFYPAFSNLFLGEVMRLDAIDLPLLSGSIKHHFGGKFKPSLQLNAVSQINGSQSREADLIAGIKLVGHARLTGILSYISSELLTQDYWMTRMELRIAF